jgi:hypothetical protein
MTAATMALASIAIVAAQAHAGSFSDECPKQVLMKSATVLQHGRLYYGSWHWYEAGEWNRVDADGLGGFPRADAVRAGSRLHIRTNKPERPASFRIRAYKKVDQFSTPIGTGRLLNTTFRRVERDGKTVGCFLPCERAQSSLLSADQRALGACAGHPYQPWDEPRELPFQDHELKQSRKGSPAFHKPRGLTGGVPRPVPHPERT